MEEKLARGLLLLINCGAEADPGGGRDIQGVFFPMSGAREIHKRVACSFSAGLDWVELVSRLRLNNKYMLID